MKSIQDLAREAGGHPDNWNDDYFDMSLLALQRFHDAAIAQYRKSLLAGAGEAVVHQFQARTGEWHPFIDDDHYHNTKEDGTWPIRELYTADQMAAAVAIEREKTEKFESALEDLMFHVEEAMRNEPQPYEIEKAYERAAAIRGQR